jgi:hypothetical protein
MRRDGRSEIKTTDGRGQTTEDGRRKSEDSLSVVRGPWRIKHGAESTAISEKCGKSEKGNYVSILGVLSLFSRLSSLSRLATWFTVYRLPFTVSKIP